jgi:glycosyltransferase involved in cell wall biosynthesis
MKRRKEPASDMVLMVGPIPVAGSYIGGIGVSMRRLLVHWDLPFPVVHFNPELCTRPYGTTGQLCGRNLLLSGVNLARLLYSRVALHPKIVHYHTSRGLAFLKDMLFAGLLRGLFRVPTVLHVRSSDSAKILASRRPRLRCLQLRILRHCCDRLVLLSDNLLSDFARILGREGGEDFRSRCTVLPNFTLLPPKSRKHTAPLDFVRVFYIGNLGREKGVYDTLEAARRLHGQTLVPFQVILAGPFNDAQEERQVRAAVAQAQLEETVVFLGTVYDGAKEAAFSQADIFVLPSYSEGIPQSMLEAMAYGLPVVVTNVGGIPEVVRDGQEGRIIQPGDVDGLCCALRGLMESVALRQKMGAAARQRIETHFTIDNYMRQLQRMYSSLLGLGGDSGGPPKDKQAES